MNDFTKEELQLLLLSYWSSPYCIEPNKDALFMKLESMIDNYCPHVNSNISFNEELKETK